MDRYMFPKYIGLCVCTYMYVYISCRYSKRLKYNLLHLKSLDFSIFIILDIIQYKGDEVPLFKCSEYAIRKLKVNPAILQKVRRSFQSFRP